MRRFVVLVCVGVGAWGAAAWNVVDGGAAGDGVTDNTAAFQQVMNAAAAAGGGVVEVPAGQYRFDGTLTIPGGVTLQGTFRIPPSDQREGRPNLDGSVLMAYAGRGSREGAPFITLGGSMATIAGFMITYPEWRQDLVPPAPYPPTIYATGNVNVGILDCCLLNSYEGIVLDGAARFLVRNVHGYPSFRGLYVDACYDIGRVENCHFWPFGVVYRPEDPYCEWVNLNGVAFEFARTDWQYVVNTFCFGYGVGYKFSASGVGSCNGNFLGIGADSCQTAMLVDTAPGTIDLLITNGEFVGRWSSTDAVGIDIVNATTQRVSLTNCAFWGPLDRAIRVRAPQAELNVTSSNFLQWDEGNVGSPAIELEGGKAIIQGNSFQREGLHVRVGEQVDSAIILANQADSGVRVANFAGDRVHLLANEVDRLTWTKRGLRHYRADIGSKGDARYVQGWHQPEQNSEWGAGISKRWSSAESKLILPVLPNKAYTMTMEVVIPLAAVDEAAGVYLGEARLAGFPEEEGKHTVTVPIPAQRAGRVELLVKTKGWVPARVREGSGDYRLLGVGVREIVMTTRRAPDLAFNANSGE
jgi:hypothetical protein